MLPHCESINAPALLKPGDLGAQKQVNDWIAGWSLWSTFLMKRRILLVDDELAILLTLKAVLEINGFEVETAASAREAKSKLRSGNYHMVITDMRMENDTSGLEVVHAAKKVPYRPAVAMLTAFPLPGSEWRDEGMDEMLVKPMNTENLLRQIEALLVTHEDKKQGPSKEVGLSAKNPSKAPEGRPASRKVARAR
jgi:DNA-binding response OmpR family regulator